MFAEGKSPAIKPPLEFWLGDENVVTGTQHLLKVLKAFKVFNGVYSIHQNDLAQSAGGQISDMPSSSIQ
jgi:hypothetical protein